MVRRAALLLVLFAGCSEGVDARAGLEAWIRISGAQFFPGPLPAPAPDGPMVVDLTSRNNAVFPGQLKKALGGHLSTNARAVAIGFAADAGYWIVPAGSPDLNENNLLEFNATASLSPALPPGPRDLEFAAVDANGHFGAPTPQSLLVKDVTVQGLLIVTLKWDTESDLDLHVMEPDGTEVWARNINDFVPPGPGEPPPDPNQVNGGGILDFDSNSQCLIDGRRQEDVTYKMRVPSGHYLVRVEAYSLCSAAFANWTVDAISMGNPIVHASGEMTDADVRLPHGAGAGTTALQFDIP